MSSTVVSLSDLNELLDVLVAIAGNWELFLIALGVSKGDINQIKTERAQLPDSSKLCLLDGLERWVKSSEHPTFGKITEALNTELITDKPLAAKVDEFARQVSQDKTVQPVKPVPAALPQPLSVDQPTSSGGTSCEPTSPPHQTPTTSDMSSALTEVGSPSQPVDGAVHHERYDKAQASAKREELRECFTSQAVRLKNHLKAKYTDEKLPDFLSIFILKLPPAVKDENEKFFNDKSLEISRSKTFDELFVHLDIYWDYLNYSLLEGIIEAHGTETMQQEMESYVTYLKEFRSKTKLFVYWLLERPKKGRTPPPGFRQFVTKHSITGESTLEDIEKIRLEITQEFHLSKFALRLIDVVEGSVLITWFVPSSVISRLQERLGPLTGLHIEDIFYDSSDIPQDPPNPQDSDSLSLPASPHSTDLEAKHTPSSRDLTPLFHAAAQSGDADTVRKLLKDGVDVNEERAGQTAVMLAARNGHADIVSILMESGADPNVGDARKNTPLMLAAHVGHTATVRALGTGSVNINASDRAGQTALMWAAECGHTDTVQALAALGADLHVQNAAGRTALMLAAERGHTDTVQALAALGADLHVKDTVFCRTALLFAASGGHTDTVQALAALGADLHVKDTLAGLTALMLAAWYGRTDTVQALATLGADIHIKDQDGQTALMLAAWYGHTDTVQALATLGADIHIKDRDSQTALMWAAERGRTDTVQALAALGSDIHTKNQDGRTALMLAAKRGHTDTVKALAALGADIRMKDRFGRTAQMLAAEYGRTHVMGPAQVKFHPEKRESYLPSTDSGLGSTATTSTHEFSPEKESPFYSEKYHSLTVPTPRHSLGSSRYLGSTDSGLESTTTTSTHEFSSEREESSSSYSESHFSHPPRLSPTWRSRYLPSSDSGLESTTTDEFSSGKEESYLSYSESGKGRRRATPPPPVTPEASQPGEEELTFQLLQTLQTLGGPTPPPPVTPGASQPREKKLKKAKTAQHRKHSQP